MKLIFERSKPGHRCTLFPKCDVEMVDIDVEKRQQPLNLPEVSENEMSRHYTTLANAVHGVNNGFYPLGSCTMKYNPKINERVASLCGFTNIHPLQSVDTIQGNLQVMASIEDKLCQITGMDNFTLQPAAGAHGEFTGLLIIKAYHKFNNDTKRNKIIVPDSAHGTNPASASMAGFEVISVPSDAHGLVDIEKLKTVVGDDTAGLMLTNPNTVGLFDKNILEITSIIHQAGGLAYYDGANLNAVMGIARPGDMGFDVVHLNLHKTFSTPHGGGGPGSGPVGCKSFLKDFLCGYVVKQVDNQYVFEKPVHSIGSMKLFYGNYLVVVKALTYIYMLGKEGLKQASQNAVLNANYMMAKLKDIYPVAYPGPCMHEFVISLDKLHHEKGVSALDVAKSLLDHGIHPPTMYFPLIVHEALMIEPTETESKETLDEAIDAFKEIYEKALNDPESLHNAPLTTMIGRPDEVKAARKPVLRAHFD